MTGHIHLKTITVLWLILALPLFSNTCINVRADSLAHSSLLAAEAAISQAFNVVIEAEQAGANVTGLLQRLHEAGSLLATANVANRTGNFSITQLAADQSTEISNDVELAAVELKETAIASSQYTFGITVGFSLLFAIEFILLLFVLWRWFKRRYINRLLDAHLEVIEHDPE